MKKFLGYCLSAKSNDARAYLYVNEWGGVVLCENTILFASKEAANGALRYISLTQYIEKYETLCVIPVIQDENGNMTALHDVDVKFCICDKDKNGDYRYMSVCYDYYRYYDFWKGFDDMVLIFDDTTHCRAAVKMEDYKPSECYALPVINGEPQLDFEPIEI